MLTSSFVGPRDAKRSEWKKWVQSRLHDTIAQLQHAKASDIYKILQPKKMVDKKKGKRGKPLPGLQDADGVWKTSRQEVAIYCMDLHGNVNLRPLKMRNFMIWKLP